MTVPSFADVQKRVPSAKRGFMLVAVLIITAVGLLFGAGALLLFRFQCQMRIDRQHELEKVYAVRSALNYIRTYTDEIPDTGETFSYHTGSERDLRLLVKPVKTIFPDLNNNRHFAMQRGDFLFPYRKQYNSLLDYEYGATGVTNLLIKKELDGRFGLAFTDLTASNSVKWWVNIGMCDTGGWLQENYGRRYYFYPQTYVEGNVTQDIIRLCIIRNVTNESNKVGCRHGWPLSREGERALVFEISPKGGESNNADMTVYEYCYTGTSVMSTPLIRWVNRPSLCNMGIQIADDKVSMFYIGNGSLNDAAPSSRGYTFSDSTQLTPLTYKYFAEEVVIGGKTYGGVFTNDDGEVKAPELRAVFEVQAASDKRNGKESAFDVKSNLDFLTDFRVTPAYQYDVFIEHPLGTEPKLATVAQKIGEYDRDGILYTVLTYDTHGTEHKGFRQDEKEARAGGGR